MSDEQAKENLITAFILSAEAIHALSTSNQTAVLAEISALKDEIAKLTAIGVDVEDNQATILAKLDTLSSLVVAIAATLEEVKASLPVPPVAEPEEPTDPIDPPIDEPVDPEEPTDPETPEVPEEPTEPEVPEEPSPILPIYTMQFPDFTTGEWQGSISKQESRFIVDNSPQHKEVFKVGNVVKFSNGDRRKIVSVLDRYNKLFVGYEGPKLSPEDVGHPHTIEVFASVEAPAEPSPTPEQPEPGTGTNIPMGVNVHEGVEPAYPLSQTERRIQMVAAANIRSYRNDMRHIENTAEVNRLINLCSQYGVILRPMLYPTTEAKAYNYAKLFGDRVKVWEIGNEVNLRGRDGAEGRIDALVATYRGMKRASDEFNLGLKFTINVTSCNPNHPSSRCSGDVTGDTWFLDMARARGFLFDYVSFHHYSHFTDSQYWLDLYLGQLRGFAERYNTKIFLNETNAGEVYNGALGSEPIYAQSVRKFLTELNAKYSDVIAEINMYELIDEPHVTVEVEKHFGMFFNIDTPKPVWEVVKEFASQSRAIEEIPGKPEPEPEPEPVESAPLVGVNFAGLGNNPDVDASYTPKLGTHYRSILDKPNVDYITRYKPANGGKWVARIPYAAERLFSVANGSFTVKTAYLDQIKAVVSALNAAGATVLLDMHNYCRWWIKTPSTPISWAQRQQRTINGVTSDAQWIPIGHELCPVDYPMLARMYVRIAELFRTMT